jgi:subtilisin family serine protease
VITDDLTYFAEPFYQDGPIAVAANNARAAGVFLTSSAGNGHASFNGYESLAFRPVACQAPLSPAATCHNFSGVGTDTSYNFTLANGGTARIVFQWAEPRFGVTQDFDIYLADTGTNTVVASGIDDNPTSERPFETVGYTNASGVAQNLALFINRFSGTAIPRLKLVFFRTSVISNVQYATPTAAGDTVGATIFGHNGAASELTVAATPFNDGVNAEAFYTHGPVTILFGPVNGTIPAPPIAPVTLLPDVTATDGGANTFFGQLSGGVWRFFGTSQAAPHAAGVAALLRQKSPSATPDQIKSALTGTATPMNGGTAVVGAGRVNAVGALTGFGCPTPRPNVGRSLSPVNAGRLQVLLNAGFGSFSSITTTGLSNATLEVNGAPLGLNQTAALTGSSTTVFVQRTGAGGPFTARFSIVDGCGAYPLFFGKGS